MHLSSAIRKVNPHPPAFRVNHPYLLGAVLKIERDLPVHLVGRLLIRDDLDRQYGRSEIIIVGLLIFPCNTDIRLKPAVSDTVSPFYVDLAQIGSGPRRDGDQQLKEALRNIVVPILGGWQF